MLHAQKTVCIVVALFALAACVAARSRSSSVSSSILGIKREIDIEVNNFPAPYLSFLPSSLSSLPPHTHPEALHLSLASLPSF